MIYITGDTHAEFLRFSTKVFPEQKEMTKEDFVIILGDFGGIWHPTATPSENYWLNWLNEKPFTTLFIDGNHENFDRLYGDEFPIVDFCGGKAHQIRRNIFHLMRGYVFTLENKTFFTLGGASSHDIRDGVLDLNDYKTKNDMLRDYNRRTRAGEMLRINHVSWWKEELPSDEEMERGIKNLKTYKFKVDYVLAHSLPQHVVKTLYGRNTDSDIATEYFQKLETAGLGYKRFFCGHYHRDMDLPPKYSIRYRCIERIL